MWLESAVIYRACEPASQSLEAAGTAARRTSLAAVVLCGLAAGGCSMSFPIMGLSSKTEDEVAMTTASVLPARSGLGAGAPGEGGLGGLAPDLGPEDVRRASGALALALDPQGNGAPVSWDNAQSGMKGRFTPVGGPFLKEDEICRAFLASMALQSGPVRLQGTACRPSGGEWSIRDAKPWKGES